MNAVRKALAPFVPPAARWPIQWMRQAAQVAEFGHLIKRNRLVSRSESGRCFVLGSGPSINDIDLRWLKGENVIALNNFYKHADYGTVNPEYYIVAPIHRPQTDAEWRAWLMDMSISMLPGTKLFCGLQNKFPSSHAIIRELGLFSEIELYYYLVGAAADVANSRNVDLERPILGSYACSVYALIIAMYLGFSEVYLLGMDHNYFMFREESSMRFYSSALHQQNEFERTFGTRFYIEEFNRIYRIFTHYESIREHAMRQGVAIYNATDSTVLKVFPTVQYEDLFSGR